MKSVFLTGSKGFIGSHLLKRLRELDYTVIEGVRDGIPLGTVDYIIHLAASTTTTDSFLPELYENNIVYPYRIFQYLPKCYPKCKIIYASSTSAAELTNPYAYTKRYLEHLGKNHVGLRFFNCFGSGNNKGIVNKAIDCAVKGSTITLYGKEQVRDFIYIDDVVRAIIGHLDADAGIYEIGTGVGTTMQELVNGVAQLYGTKIPIIEMPMMKTDMLHSVANPGLPNCLSLRDGLIKMMNDE